MSFALLIIKLLLIIQKYLIQSIKLNFGKHYNLTNIDPSYINLLAKIYENAKSEVKTKFGTTNLFRLLKGVRQRYISSAILFCLILIAILIFVYNDIECSFKITVMILSNIAFADDLALVTYTALEVNILIERLRTQSKNFGLSINVSKTKLCLLEITLKKLLVT